MMRLLFIYTSKRDRYCIFIQVLLGIMPKYNIFEKLYCNMYNFRVKLFCFFKFYFFGFGKFGCCEDGTLFIVKLQVLAQHLLRAVSCNYHDRR